MIATIASGQTTSSGLDLGVTLVGSGLIALGMPAAFTGTALSFQSSLDGGTTYQSVTDTTGSALSVTVSAGVNVHLKQDQRSLLQGIRWIRVISNASEGGARQIVLYSV